MVSLRLPFLNGTTLSMTGRTLGIVPRKLAKEGYVDLEQDDYEVGTLLHKLELGALAAGHRNVPRSSNK
jgi:hypothetical protein